MPGSLLLQLQQAASLLPGLRLAAACITVYCLHQYHGSCAGSTCLSDQAHTGTKVQVCSAVGGFAAACRDGAPELPLLQAAAARLLLAQPGRPFTIAMVYVPKLPT